MSRLTDAFENTAARWPDKKAVGYRDASYSFRQLRDTARGLAGKLAGLGEAGTPVAVLVNRDADTVVLFLSVLLSGHFYVALDPDLPAGKLAKILADAAPAAVLIPEEDGTPVPAESDPALAVSRPDTSGGKAGLRAKLAEAGYTGPVLTLADAAPAASDVLPEIPEDAPAYMIYTSGSTGQPKGVVKTHAAVYSFITAFTREFHLGAEEIIGNQTPFFFDASAKDYYYMLTAGATLEVLPSELFIFPVTLIEYMNQRQITYICWVPSAMVVVTQLGTFRKVVPETLRYAFFVGEVFPMKHLRQWAETLPQVRYVNLYGSTELAGICCYQEVDAAVLASEAIPMGRPLPNCRVWLRRPGAGESEGSPALDIAEGNAGKPAGSLIFSPGETGEVMIASPSLASGYYHDPARTAEVFVTLELPDGSSVRALASGDLARYDEEGLLHFVSRKDFQIKHMGRRIELGEIETAADALPELARCCCLYDTARKKITLFAEPSPGAELTGRDVIRRLKDSLSDYMVPGKVILMDRLPANRSGKIDRQALKALLQK